MDTISWSLSGFPLVQLGEKKSSPMDFPGDTKTCVNGHSQTDQKLFFKTKYCLMQIKSIAEFSKGSILQYF